MSHREGSSPSFATASLCNLKQVASPECKLTSPGCCKDLLRPQIGTSIFQVAGLEHRTPYLFPLLPCSQWLPCVLPTTWHLGSAPVYFSLLPPPQFNPAIYPRPSSGCLFICLCQARLLIGHNGPKIALPLVSSRNLVCGLRSVRTEERLGVWQACKKWKGSRRSPVSREGRYLSRVIQG